MVMSQHLKSFHIIENDNVIGSSNLVTWTYPTITGDLKSYLELNSFSITEGESYLCLRRNLVWIYLKRNNNSRKKNKFAVALFTDEFNPLKYKSICDLLSEKYLQCQSPVDLVQIYLNLYTRGSAKLEDNGTTLSCDLKNFQNQTNIKDLIQDFNLEVILIYNAILLKRRLLVFNKNIKLLQAQLFSISRIIPSIRNVLDCLIPFIDSSKDLKGLSFYVAGTNSEKFLNEHKLYDIFVNMESLEITISPQSKEVMAMSKIHKDLATLMVKLAESNLTDLEICEKITQKTSEVLRELKSLTSITTESNIKMLTVSDLKKRNYSSTMENFLFNLALAENIMML